MGQYGSIWAHIKTGRSPMAQDHFKTPPDPQKGGSWSGEGRGYQSVPGHDPSVIYTYMTTLWVIRRLLGGGLGRDQPRTLTSPGRALRPAVEISRWDDLLRPAVEIICWDYLLRLSLGFSCWDYPLSWAAEMICWDKLLWLSVEIIS